MTARRFFQVQKTEAKPLRRKVLVWDAPVRVFHWLMVMAFAGAWLTGEQDDWRLVHVSLGYTMAGLVGFRLAWGLVGTRHARFSAFVRGPAAAWRYLRTLLSGKPAHYTGHNPAGALAILALLGLTLLVGLTGWATLYGHAAETMEELHEALATLMLGVVGIHVLGVLLGSWLDRENLIGAMLTGYKKGQEGDGVSTARRAVAALLLLGVIGFLAYQWQTPGIGAEPAASLVSHTGSDDDREHGSADR